MGREISVTVNGAQHTSDVEPRLLLVEYLRDVLNLTGTHVGVCWKISRPIANPPVWVPVGSGRGDYISNAELGHRVLGGVWLGLTMGKALWRRGKVFV